MSLSGTNTNLLTPTLVEIPETISMRLINVMILLSHIFNTLIGISFVLSWDLKEKKLRQYNEISPKQIQQILIGSIIVSILFGILGLCQLSPYVVKLAVTNIILNLGFLGIYVSIFYYFELCNKTLTDNVHVVNVAYVISTSAMTIGHMTACNSEYPNQVFDSESMFSSHWFKIVIHQD